MAFYLGSNQIDNLNFVTNSDFYNEENAFLQRSLTQFNSDITTIGSYAFCECDSLISINLSQATTIGSYAFASCYSLTSINLPQVTTIESYAFRSCTSLISIDLPQATRIESCGFYYCNTLVSISLPQVTTIKNSAFAFCSTLASINLPQVTTVGNYAFYSCASLTSVNLPLATTIGSYAFSKCYELAFVQCSALTIISGSYTFTVKESQSTTTVYGRFAHCSSLQTVSFPKVQTIHSTAFYQCSYLTSFIGPSVLTVGGSYRTSRSTYKGKTYRFSIYAGAFAYCYRLSLVSLPQVTAISTYAFYRCYNLLSLYLLGSSIPILSATAFYSTPISTYTTSTGGVHGSIYVPASLYSSYIAAGGWSIYSERIVSV